MAPFRRGQKKDIPKERGCLPRDVPLPLFVQIDQLVLPAAVQDFRIGIPGMLLQVFGGYLFIKYVIRK